MPQTGDPLARWVGEFLAEEARADVRTKLMRSELSERHAVVFLPSLSTAPYAVVDLLFRSDAPLPEISPSLPPEITHVWAFSGWTSGSAFHWTPSDGWLRFRKL